MTAELNIMTFFRFVPFFQIYRRKLYTFNTGHTILCNLSRLMGISALKIVFRNIENSQRNWRKPFEKN